MSKRRQGTEAAVAAPPDHNQRMRTLALKRLEELFADATAGRFYGKVAVEITFENGRPVVIHRRIEGADK